MGNEIKEKITGIINGVPEPVKKSKKSKDKPVPYRIKPSTNKKVKSWRKLTNSKTYDEAFGKVNEILKVTLTDSL